MKIFKKGDFVEVIDEDLEGEVAFAKADIVTILTKEGFSMEFPKSSLVQKKKLKVKDIPEYSKVESVCTPRFSSNPNTSLRELIIDLHIHEIVDNDRYLSSFEKLQYQINEAKSKLAQARAQKIGKVIFIHGVGKGVLRKELYKLLEGSTGIEFYDADYASYGRGATEVRLYKFDV